MRRFAFAPALVLLLACTPAEQGGPLQTQDVAAELLGDISINPQESTESTGLEAAELACPDCQQVSECGGDACGIHDVQPEQAQPEVVYESKPEADGACVPDCAGRDCGSNGCGGLCGSCSGGQFCTGLGHCEDKPGCAEVTKIGCCDGEFLWACVNGQVAAMDCAGTPHCGWSTAEGGYACGTQGQPGPAGAPALECPWVCHPQCEGVQCGPDGCGGLCGVCGGESVCTAMGHCCSPACDAKQCGSDGCGASCGVCQPDEVCNPQFLCVTPCGGGCDGKQCGTDGCGGSCGTCQAGKTCTDAGKCVTQCVPDCEGKHCGSNGCGGTCAPGCTQGTFCAPDGSCVEECPSQCDAKQCGPDGCGGQCGACPTGVACTIDGHCGTGCLACGFEPGCTALGFESGNLAGWDVYGDALVTGSLGPFQPVEGQRLLDLSNASTDDKKPTAIRFQTCVPTGTSMLRFAWRMVSLEFVEYCGSQFTDRFTASVTWGGGSATFSRTIDDLCPSGAYAAPLTQTDLLFDQPAVHAVAGPWLVAHVPLAGLTAAAGTPVTLSFEVADIGDGIFDTHLLIDRVEFLEGCQDQCGDDQCGGDGCGLVCGWCDAGTCQQGQCVCVPSCASKQCGPDGCGGSCGTCGAGKACVEGTCKTCTPACDLLQCGDDGCGGSCGNCPAGSTCLFGLCLPGGGMGADCTQDSDCAQGLICRDKTPIPFPSGQYMCTQECSGGLPGTGNCPEGWLCAPNLAPPPDSYCVHLG